MPRKPSVIRSAKDIYEAFKGISRYKRERMYSILLDGESVIGVEKVSSGSEGLVLVASRRIPNLALMVPFCEGRRNGYPLSNNHS